MNTIILLIAWIGLSFLAAMIVGRAIANGSRVGPTDKEWRDFNAAMGTQAPEDVVRPRRGPYDWRSAGDL